MKTIIRLAFAGAIAAATLLPTVTAADAGGKNWHRRHYNNYGWNPGSAFLAGTVLGLGFGALASPYYYAPPPPPVYYYPPPPQPYFDDYGYDDSAHIDWCSRTYRSYNAESDTWVDFAGVVHQCEGPY